MDILADVKRKLARDKRSLQEIARATRVPFSTLRYIKTGSTVSPRYVTLMKLYEALK